MQLQFDSHTA